MRNALLLSLLLTSVAGAIVDGQPAAQQTQPTPAPKPTQPPSAPRPTQAAPAPKPAQPAPSTQPPTQTPAPVRRAPAPTARGGLAITVTDPSGATIPGVTVVLSGPTERSSESNASGQVNFPGLLAGTYRLRFADDAVVTFEKEVAVRGGQVQAVDVKLNPAPRTPPPPAPAPAAATAPPPPAAVAKTGPTGAPQFLSIPKVLEENFVGKDPRRESLLSCSGDTRAAMLQINQPLPERMYEEADIVYYVIGGEGTMRLNGREVRLSLNDFVSVPKGGSHSFSRRGNRTLILLSVLGGEICDEAH